MCGVSNKPCLLTLFLIIVGGESMGCIKQENAFGACADIEGPDQSVQMCNLMRAFVVR